jgi:hypothetical protein
MGLLAGDLEEVPPKMTMRECYRRVYEWHKRHGSERIKAKYGRDDAYSRTYAELLKSLPSPESASDADMAFVFGEVIYMLMEWAYHEEDDQGIKMAAYAHYVVNKWFDGSLRKLQDEARRSKLYEQFGYEKWKERK